MTKSILALLLLTTPAFADGELDKVKSDLCDIRRDAILPPRHSASFPMTPEGMQAFTAYTILRADWWVACYKGQS